MADTKKFCIHSNGLGYCDILSDDKTKQYCVEGPCPHEKIVEYGPVKHGEWISLTECANAGVYCSVCHKKVYKEDYAWCNKKNKVRSNYCPNCGAKMKG